MMTDDQFDAMADLLGLHAGPAADGARMVLVHGIPIGKAAELAGCSRQSVGNTVKRCRRCIDLARRVVGS